MGYYIDGKSIEIDNKRIIGQGKKGNVYKYDQDTAIKVFKDGQDTPIDENTAEELSKISTDRIILPKSLLFYNNAFRGYTYRLVPKIGSGKRIIMLSKTDLVQDIRVLESDVETLSKQRVLLNGITPENTIFNGELYLTDPTGYRKLEDGVLESIEELNKLQLHLLLIKLITTELNNDKRFSSEVKNNIKTLLSMKNENMDSSEFLSSIIYQNDSIKEFAKKM